MRLKAFPIDCPYVLSDDFRIRPSRGSRRACGRFPRQVVRQAAVLIHPSSPYRKCLDTIISMAGNGASFDQVASAVADRWHLEYPATNNAVANGGFIAAGVWFGEGDFLKTVNLIFRGRFHRRGLQRGQCGRGPGGDARRGPRRRAAAHRDAQRQAGVAMRGPCGCRACVESERLGKQPSSIPSALRRT